MKSNNEDLFMDTTKVLVNPLAVKLWLEIHKKFTDKDSTAFEMVRDMILFDVILFRFGGRTIQYTRGDLRKVLMLFPDSTWTENAEDALKLIWVIDDLYKVKRRMA
jgi:hypothetical protein